MNAYMNKNNGIKAVAVFAIFVMVVCAFAAIIPSVDAAGTDYKMDSEETPITVTDADGNETQQTLAAAMKLLNSDSTDGYEFTFAAGNYDVTNTINTSQTGSAFVVYAKNVTIGAADGAEVLIYCKTPSNFGTISEDTTNGVYIQGQSTITIYGENVKIQGFTIMPIIFNNSGNYETYKSIWCLGNNPTIAGVDLIANDKTSETLSTATHGGSILIEGSENVVIENTTVNNGSINTAYITEPATVTVRNTTIIATDANCNGINYTRYDGSEGTPSNVEFTGSNIEIQMNGTEVKASKLINNAPAGSTINVNENVTLDAATTIKSGVTVSIAAEKTVTAGTNADVTLEGRLAGAGKLAMEDNTLNVLPGSNYNSNNVTVGTNGSITGSTTWENVILEGTYDSILNGKDNQKVTVVDDLVIGTNADITIAGQLIVNEGATVTIKSGASISIEDGATVEINGDVTIEGSSTADATFQFNGKSMNVTGSVTLEGANSYSSGTGEVTISGTFEIEEEATAAFAKATVAQDGELVIYGLASGAVANNGTVTINTMGVAGASPEFINNLNIQMGNGAIVNAIAVVGTVNVSDSDLTFKSNGQDNPAKYNNYISLKDVAGVVITEQMEIKTDADTNKRYGDNAMIISGNVTGSTHIDSITQSVASSITISDGQAIINSDVYMTDVALNVNNGAELKVTGNLTMTRTAGSTTESAPLTGEGIITVNSAEVTVTGTITANSAISGTTVNAAMYSDANPVMYHYTTLEAALASGNTKIIVTGEIEVTSDATIPVGTTVTSEGATINVAEEATLTVAAQDRNSGKLQNGSGSIIVDGTLVVDNLDRSGVNEANIVSDTSSKVGDSATYTNIYNALENAQSGETVEITKAGTGTDGYKVTLDKDATVNEGVTLVVPSVNTLYVDNGVTLTVDGTMVVDGTLDIAEKVEATSTAAAKDAGEVSVNGMMKYLTDTDSFTEKIVGAYFYYDGYETITTLENAAAIVNEIDDAVIDLYGTMTVGDVAFNYTGDYEMSLVAHNKLTAGNITLGALTFEAATGSAVTATIVLTNGSIALDNVCGVEIADVVSYDASNNTTYTATITGTITAVQDDRVEGAEKGTVTVNGDVSSGANISDANVTVNVPTDGTLTVTAGTINNVVVEGTLTATSSVTITTASVTGTIDAENAEISVGKLFAGVTVNKDNVVTVGSGNAVIGNNVTVTGVAYVAPGTTVGEAVTDMDKVTEYYIDDTLFVTAYSATSDTTKIGDIEAPAENAKFENWQYDNNGTMANADQNNIGAENCDKVYAKINYTIYDIDVSACPGATVYIDGKEWVDYIENMRGTLYAYGQHTITVYVAPGYEGTPVIQVNGQEITGGTFELTGDTEIIVSGVTAIDYSQIGSGSSGSSDGLGLTDYLLIILVVLIVIMAIMVAMRLMRS